MTLQQFTVTGMTCNHCEMSIQRAIKQLDTQANIHIDRTKNLVEISSNLPRTTLIGAIKGEGYEVVDP